MKENFNIEYDDFDFFEKYIEPAYITLNILCFQQCFDNIKFDEIESTISFLEDLKMQKTLNIKEKNIINRIVKALKKRTCTNYESIAYILVNIFPRL